MKKSILILFAFTLLVSISCQQNAVAPKPNGINLPVSQVPMAVQSSLTSNFPSATNTVWQKVAPTVYQAAFTSQSSAMLASFKSSGTVMYSNAQIDPATLPAAITDYLKKNYSGYVILKAGSKTDPTSGAVTSYLVEFSLNNIIYELRFDATGNLLSLEMETGERESDQIAANNLLPAITAYLTANYAGYTFLHARADNSNGAITGYKVEIKFNGNPVGLRFDATGKFLSLETNSEAGDHGNGQDSSKVVLQSDLLSAITSYLTTNYSGFAFVSAHAKMNGTVVMGYDVEIKYNSNPVGLRFDATGKFLSLETNSEGGDHGNGQDSSKVVLQSDLLSAITSYLTTNYSGFAFVSAHAKLTGPTVVGYKVEITYNGKTYDIEFDGSGKFLQVD